METLNKSINVDFKVWKKLTQFKLNGNFKTYSKLIEKLIEGDFKKEVKKNGIQ